MNRVKKWIINNFNQQIQGQIQRLLQAIMT